MSFFNPDFGTKNGKGVKKNEKKSRWSVFWRILKEKFGKLCLVNLIYCAFMIPFILFLSLLFFNMVPVPESVPVTQEPQTEAAVTLPAQPETVPTTESGEEEAKWSDVALPLVGSFLVLGPACMLFLLFVFMNGFSPWLVLGVTLYTVLTFGPATTALTRIVRNFVSGKPCFVWSDFKKAFKQSYLRNVMVGLADLFISCVMAYAVYAYYGTLAAESTFINQLLFFISVAILLLYAFVRHYIYLMQTTFDLKVVHVLKNSFIMALYGLVKNLGAFLLNAGFYLIFFLGYTAWFAPVIVLMPLAVLFSFPVFFSTYIVYPDFYTVMIKPEEDKQPQENGPSPIFIDRG